MVTERGEVLDARLAGTREVQVDTGQPGGVRGEADEHGRPVQNAQQRQPPVVRLDVHDDEGVRHRALGDPVDALLPLVLREEEDIVVVLPGGGQHGGGELHDHGHMDALPEGQHEADHP